MTTENRAECASFVPPVVGVRRRPRHNDGVEFASSFCALPQRDDGGSSPHARGANRVARGASTVHMQNGRGRNRSKRRARGSNTGKKQQTPEEPLESELVIDPDLLSSVEFAGWSSDDDEYWKQVRTVEKSIRGPNVDYDPAIGPSQPRDRYGKPASYPAACMYDPNLGDWRPTSEEEEKQLSEPPPYDPYYVPEMPLEAYLENPGAEANGRSQKRGNGGILAALFQSGAAADEREVRAGMAESTAERAARDAEGPASALPVLSEPAGTGTWVESAGSPPTDSGNAAEPLGAEHIGSVPANREPHHTVADHEERRPKHTEWVQINELAKMAGLRTVSDDDDDDDDDGSSFPYSPLAFHVVYGRASIPRGSRFWFDDGRCNEMDAFKGQEQYTTRKWRRPLDLMPGAWRVVNLGTSSAVPTRKRNVSCTAFVVTPVGQDSRSTSTQESASTFDETHDAQGRPLHDVNEPSMFLVDVGEGSSQRLQKAFWCTTHGFRWIRAIFITHLHGDHIYGLPNLLYDIGQFVQYRRRIAVENGDDSDPVIRIFGPCGTRGIVRASLHWTGRLGVRFSISELLPRDTDFAHLEAGLRPPVGSEDRFIGGEDIEPIDLKYDSPPPLLDEERAEDIECGEDGVWHVWNGEDGSGVEVVAAPLKHRVACFGYVFREIPTAAPRADAVASSPAREGDAASSGAETPPIPLVEIDVGRARTLGVHGRQYGVLRSGRSVVVKKTGRVVSPAEVAIDHEPPRTDAVPDLRKVVLLGDTCDSSAIEEVARGADLITHEATFSAELADKARIAMHSTAGMAGAFAKRVMARMLVLTHFSSRYEANQLVALISETNARGSMDNESPLPLIPDPKSGPRSADDDQHADTEEDEDEDVDSEDLVSTNLLVREASDSAGGDVPVVAATDFMEHTVFRERHGDIAWRQRVAKREQNAYARASK